MENKPQAADATGQPRDTAASHEPVSPAPRVFAPDGSQTERRVAEPAVATDGQLVEAGYGHGV